MNYFEYLNIILLVLILLVLNIILYSIILKNLNINFKLSYN